MRFIGDVHLGNHRRFAKPWRNGCNSRFQQTLAVLNEALQQAPRDNMTAILGDLFDTVRPSPQMIREVQDVLRDHHVVIIAGNHDKASEDPRDNALAPLESSTCHVVDTEPELWTFRKRSVCFAPFRAEQAAHWIAADIHELELTLKRLSLSINDCTYATHVGLIDSKTPPWLLHAVDAVTLDVFPRGLRVVAGNWHHYKALTSRITQIGALVPTGFDNPSEIGKLKDYGMVLTEGVMHPTQLAGPRFYKLYMEELRDASMRRTSGPDTVYLQVIAESAEMTEAHELLACMIAEKRVVGGEVVLDAAEKMAARNAAASAVRKSSSIDEAIHAYVGKLALPADTVVTKDAVAARVLHYTTEAGKQ